MRSDRLLAQFGTVMGLSLGFLILYLAAVFIVMAVIETRPRVYERTDYGYSLMEVKGEILREKWLAKGDPDISTLDGRSVKLPERYEYRREASLDVLDPQQVDSANRRFPEWGIIGFYVGRRGSPWFFIQRRTGSQLHGYFVHYSKQSRAPTTYLGANGESATPPPPDQQFQLRLPDFIAELEREIYSTQVATRSPLSEDVSRSVGLPLGIVYFHSTTGLERVDLNRRIVAKVVADPDLQSFAKHAVYETDKELGERAAIDPRLAILLRGKTTIVEVPLKGIRSKYIIPESLRGINLGVYPINADSIYFGTSALGLDGNVRHQKVFQCDAAGRIIKDWSLPQPQVKSANPIWAELGTTTLFPTPLLMGAAYVVNEEMAKTPVRELVHKYMLTIVLLLVYGTLSSLAAWRLAPRFSGASAQWGWLVFVFIAGLPGLAGYLMHFRRRIRPVLEPAARLGTEIFA